jgi:pimeloyl-ACP methyl ester carboxylesterase
MTTTTEMVDTRVGRLHVEVDGDGPPAVLWHSLFVDSTSWSRLRPSLGGDRRLIAIDGPGHGPSSIPPAGFAFEECAGAAVEVLDALGVREPVDWVGNAWGGHVGLDLGARSPERLRSLVTVATPAHALTRGERLNVVPMVWAYRVVGPVGPLARGVARVLLGSAFMKSRPDDTQMVLRSFRDAPKTGMLRAMESVMLNRPDITPLLADVEVPTVMVAPRNDPMLTVAQVRTAVDRLPVGAMVELDADGHVAPILEHADELADIIKAFWRDPRGYVVG